MRAWYAIDAARVLAYEMDMGTPRSNAADVRAPAAIHRFRMIAMLEGVSFLVLLCVAMPLKYYAGLPIAVRIVGMAHGVLFVAYAVIVAMFVFRKVWSVSKGAEAMMYSLLPFGTFVLDAKLKREVQGA